MKINLILHNIIYLFLFISKNIIIKAQKDIFDITKNLSFCGADLQSKKINISSKRNNKKRVLSINKYKPMRIFVETEYFEYQGSLYQNLNDKVPILKSALNGAVEGIKNLLQVEDKEDNNLFSFLNSQYFIKNNITKWSSVFDTGENINADFLIIVKFDFENAFPENVIASAIPIDWDKDTLRPLVGLLTITKDVNYYSYRRVKEYFRLVLLHELTHALGFLFTMFPYFPGGIENTYKTEYIRNYYRYIIKTPKVIETARKYFNCSYLNGVELEDQGGGGSAGSHWEQRILLGDYMGAVIYQEEMAISEITLALLEDTGWYKANYYTGGLMRFGKNKGCEFIYNNCLYNYTTAFDNEFFDYKEAFTPSCSTGRQSRTYSYLYTYSEIDSKYGYNSVYDFNNNRFSSGTIYTSDYCFTHGQSLEDRQKQYFVGHCKYGTGEYGINIYYINPETNNYEKDHENSEFSEELGEIYSNTSFCIMSSLTPEDKYTMFNSIPHPMCYQVYCSSKSLTIKINNDFVVCPREGGNVNMTGYDGYLHCPDYNLICTGSEICNDIFDCIEKKSLVKESSFYYDYIPITTQRFSQIGSTPITEAYELSEDGFCPLYCAQCDINKRCKKCKEGYNLIGNKSYDITGPIICDNNIDVNNKKYFLRTFDNIYFLCNDECNGCLYDSNYCQECQNNFYFLDDINYCYKKEDKIESYYFNETLQKFVSCHKNCKTCSKGPISDEKQNCDSCKDEFSYNKSEKNCETLNFFKALWIVISIVILILIVGVILVLYFFFRTSKLQEQEQPREIKVSNSIN